MALKGRRGVVAGRPFGGNEPRAGADVRVRTVPEGRRGVAAGGTFGLSLP